MLLQADRRPHDLQDVGLPRCWRAGSGDHPSGGDSHRRENAGGRLGAHSPLVSHLRRNTRSRGGQRRTRTQSEWEMASTSGRKHLSSILRNRMRGKETDMGPRTPARTYNQNHIPRKYTAGKRRLSIYWTWSYPWESQRDPAEMENRFSTMTEVRNVLWPDYETPEWSAAQFLQGIAGTLELFHRSTLNFQQIAGEATGHPVAVFQRIDQAGYKLPIDERILADTDTLLVFGLDHLLSEQEASPEEIAAIRHWLKREGTCLLLAPHHDVGFTSDLKQRQMEYLHHGDRLVP